jgi:hypothetical protein
MTMKEVTPEFLKDFQLDRDVTTPFSETTPILQRILCAATQTVIMFTGAGCKNYTSEFLHFIQNLRKVWTPAIAYV